MTDNTANAIKAYKTFLTKNKLKEAKEYSVDFELKSYLDKDKISKVKPMIVIDSFELSPMIMFECYNDKGLVGSFGFADSKYILDKYDKDGIITNIENDICTHDYDVKLVKDILDKIKIKL
mgnify:CR=1 FL=1